MPVELRVSVADPYAAYRRARADTGGVYLETTGGQSGWGYFGVEPAYWETVHADDARGSFESLERLTDRETLVRGECDVPYPCGAFGWLSYDAARELEELPDTTTNERGLPRVQLAVYDCVAAWEEPYGGSEVRVTACPRVPADADPRDRYDAGVERAHTLADRIRTGDPSVPSVARDAGEFTSNCGMDGYADRVRTVKGYVRDGDTFQANVSQRLSAPVVAHPVAVFDALRAVNPAPYSALVEFPGVDLLSASPELLLDVDGRELLTEPIAGTRPRGDTPAEDERLRRDLLDDEKEHAEHAMLVDLERNDLGKVSAYGSVEVTDYRRIDSYSEVMHTVSAVASRRRADASLVDAIRAVFPGGTITGAPKPRTMAIIDEVEGYRRGPYTGSVGVIGFDDRATLNMTIRTLTRYADRYDLRVGAGIVHDSVPEAEFVETLDKGRALITALDDALGEHATLATPDWPTGGYGE